MLYLIFNHFYDGGTENVVALIYKQGNETLEFGSYVPGKTFVGLTKRFFLCEILCFIMKTSLYTLQKEKMDRISLVKCYMPITD